MRDTWYSDNRDLLKWGVLLTLAERFAAKHILQVLYYRSTDWAGIELDGEQVPLPPAVIQHFRRVAAASAINRPQQSTSSAIPSLTETATNAPSSIGFAVDRRHWGLSFLILILALNHRSHPSIMFSIGK